MLRGLWNTRGRWVDVGRRRDDVGTSARSRGSVPIDASGLRGVVAGKVDLPALARESHRLFADEDLADLRGGVGAACRLRETGKAACDWEDAAAREVLPDELAGDACAVSGVLDGQTVNEAVWEAGELVATVVGQDLERRDDGVRRPGARRAAGCASGGLW